MPAVGARNKHWLTIHFPETYFMIQNLLRACAIALAVSLTLPVQARNLRAAESQVPDYPTVEGVKYMGKLLDERSAGKLKLKVFPNGTLGSERDMVEQLKIGGLDLARISLPLLNNMVPESLVPSLPFIFRNEDHMHAVLDGAIGDDILAAMSKQGLIGLAWYDDGARSIYSKKPIRRLADLKGLKLRVQQSDISVAMTEALGASPTPLPYGEVYTAITTGIIDAAENSVLSYETSRHFEVAKYYNETEHMLQPSVVVFSKAVWDRLSESERTLIRQAAKDSVPFGRKLAKERQAKSRADVLAKGTTLIKIEDRDEFIKAIAPVYAQYAPTPELKSLIKRIQDTK
ncbi:TRAP transporter substrate-binding protein [Xylophilus sp.]|uniref:TRAP transporter substrate-binding protein n=1 Tax=Xylophilus sp. TaxID=2653893 RepID=UPI002D805AB1|nr:TRAP transporter substrate-binding protein [Xylophilus sp.]